MEGHPILQVACRPDADVHEIEPFGALWTRLGLDDVDMNVLQLTILASPGAGRVVTGTNGLRKLRFAAPGSGRGKSGTYRVFYLNAPEHGFVALWAVLNKTEAENLTKAESRFLAARVTAFKTALERRKRP